MNKFIRPAVEQIQTVKGEQEALGTLEDSGPQFELQQIEGAAPAGGAPGAGGAAPAPGALPGAKGATMPPGPPLQPGPTKAKAGDQSWLKYSNQNAKRRLPLKPELVNAMSFLADMGITMEVFSGGQKSAAELRKEGQAKGLTGQALTAYVDSQRTGGHRHDGGGAADVFFYKDGRRLDWKDPVDVQTFIEIKARAEAEGVTGWGAGDGYMRAASVHLGFGGNAKWGKDGKGQNAAAWLNGSTDNINSPTGPTGMAGSTDYELKAVNGKTFEPRLPFTVRDAAFNATADRVIGARAAEAMETGMMLAQQKANGDLGILRTEMEKVRSEVMSTLPKELPGLQTDLDAAFTRGMGAAERQALDLKQRQKIAETTTAMQSQAASVQAEVERLALTGAGSAQISAALAAGQDSLAAYGPREGFVVNGKVYAPDPSRAGIMSPAEIASGIGKLGASTSRIMIEAEFMKSAAPGQFVEEFRKEIFSGRSPLGVGESLDLLSQLQGRANSAESARRTAANAERERLQKEYKDRINPYVEMTEQGVPVAIPPQERQRILTSLAPYPDLQREAEIEFAVADAAVATHGMRGAEVIAYTDTVREDLAAAAGAGVIDFEAVAVLQSLEDRVKKAQDAVSAEMIGLPMIEQLALDGATSTDINWQGLRDQAAGNEEVLNQIDATEAFYRDVESLTGMTADERDRVLAEARAMQADLAASGQGYGSAALQTQKVIDKLADWSEKRADLAANDSMAFARSAGVAMPSMEGAQSMSDVGSVLADRVALLAPLTASEGVKHPVPLESFELAALSEVYANSSRADQTAFLSQITALGQEQAEAIFSKIGKADPLLYAAGTVYAGGNQAAAGVILRGNSDAKLPGGTPDEVAGARASVLGDLLEADMIDPASVSNIDAAANAYARGLAMSEGGRAITQADLTAGYEIAMGMQEDGTGGVQYSRYGTTVLPAGWDSDRLDGTLNGMTDEHLEIFAGGKVVDARGRPFGAADLRRTIEQLRVDPENPKAIIPLDDNGAFFIVDKGGVKEVLTFDLGKWGGK